MCSSNLIFSPPTFDGVLFVQMDLQESLEDAECWGQVKAGTQEFWNHVPAALSSGQRWIHEGLTSSLARWPHL